MQEAFPITSAILDEMDEGSSGIQFQPIRSLEMVGRNMIQVTNQSGEANRYQVSSDAQHNLADFLAVPYSYFNKIDDDELVMRNWNYWMKIRNQNADVTALKAVTNDQGEMLATSYMSYQPLKPSEVVSACALAMDGAMLERRPYVGHHKFAFHLTSPALYEDFMKETAGGGDVHHFSVGVTYHMLGTESPSMHTYGHRHFCGNLMQSAYGVSGKNFRIYSTEPSAVMQKFAEYTHKGMEFIRMTMIPKIRLSMDAKLDNPLADMNDIMVDNGIPERIRDIALESYRQENLGGTMYHVANALTRAANSDRVNPEDAQRLQRLAGETTVKLDPAVEGPARCQTCHHILKDGKRHNHNN
jgi:hypothetical protein